MWLLDIFAAVLAGSPSATDSTTYRRSSSPPRSCAVVGALVEGWELALSRCNSKPLVVGRARSIPAVKRPREGAVVCWSFRVLNIRCLASTNTIIIIPHPGARLTVMEHYRLRSNSNIFNSSSSCAARPHTKKFLCVSVALIVEQQNPRPPKKILLMRYVNWELPRRAGK